MVYEAATADLCGPGLLLTLSPRAAPATLFDLFVGIATLGCPGTPLPVAAAGALRWLERLGPPLWRPVSQDEARYLWRHDGGALAQRQIQALSERVDHLHRLGHGAALGWLRVEPIEAADWSRAPYRQAGAGADTLELPAAGALAALHGAGPVASTGSVHRRVPGPRRLAAEAPTPPPIPVLRRRSAAPRRSLSMGPPPVWSACAFAAPSPL